MNKTDRQKEYILNTCKYCRSFTENGIKRNRYQCEKYHCSIYNADKCKKLSSSYRTWVVKNENA